MSGASATRPVFLGQAGAYGWEILRLTLYNCEYAHERLHRAAMAFWCLGDCLPRAQGFDQDVAASVYVTPFLGAEC